MGERRRRRETETDEGVEGQQQHPHAQRRGKQHLVGMGPSAREIPTQDDHSGPLERTADSPQVRAGRAGSAVHEDEAAPAPQGSSAFAAASSRRGGGAGETFTCLRLCVEEEENFQGPQRFDLRRDQQPASDEPHESDAQGAEAHDLQPGFLVTATSCLLSVY